MSCFARDELQRYVVDLLEDKIWDDVSGLKGGFISFQ